MKRHIATLLYATGVSCFGAIGLFRTWSGLDAYGASFVRGAWGALTLLLGALLFNPRIIKVSISYMIRCLIWGAILGLAIFVYFKTMDYSNQSIGALFLFLQVVWYPIYMKLVLPEESRKTRWSVYIPSQVITVLATFLALGLFDENITSHLSIKAVIYGFLVSFMAFVYFVIGRWLFFEKYERENKLSKIIFDKLSLRNMHKKLSNDEITSSKNHSDFWISYQKTLYQSFGMVLVCFIYIPYDVIFWKSLMETQALANGILLGIICLAAAFFFITFADSVTVIGKSGEKTSLSTKVKGISMQIELILALLLGYFVLQENIGFNGFFGCFILLISYMVGVLFSEKELRR